MWPPLTELLTEGVKKLYLIEWYLSMEKCGHIWPTYWGGKIQINFINLYQFSVRLDDVEPSFVIMKNSSSVYHLFYLF